MRLPGRRLHRRARLGLLLILLALVLLMHFRYLPMVRQLADMEVSNETSNLITDAVSACVREQELTYADLVRLDKNASGGVTAVQIDTARVNLLRAELMNELTKRIPDMDSRSLGVPIGSLLFPALFSGKGGKLPVRVISMRGANAELQSEFTQAGINQTLHSLELSVSVEILSLTPAGFITSEVTTKVPVAQTVIVGAVPDTLLTIGE